MLELERELKGRPEAASPAEPARSVMWNGMTPAEWARAFREWADSPEHCGLPVPPPEAYERESFYE